MSLCPFCMTFFESDKNTGRPAVYCGDACKMKSYRLRQKPLRYSKESQKIVTKPKKQSKKVYVQAELFEGVSGTVHRLPVQSVSAPLVQAPVIRTIDGLKAFFNA